MCNFLQPNGVALAQVSISDINPTLTNENDVLCSPVQHALDLDSSQPLASVLQTPKREHERNPIDTPKPNDNSSPLTDWSVSPGRKRVGNTGSPLHSPSPPGPSAKLDDSIDPSTTSFLTLPTPAQRQKDSQPLPKSSPPASSLQLPNSAPRNSSPSRSYPPLLNRRQITRKVPRPPEPFPPNRASNGPERVLVPNSDTSGSVSQPYSQSQSQSQSQRRASRLSNNVTMLEQIESELEKQPVPQRRKDVSPPVQDPEDANYDGDLSSGSTDDDGEGVFDTNNNGATDDEESADQQQNDNHEESGSDEEEEVDQLQDETDTEQVPKRLSVAPDHDASEDETDELDDDDAQIFEQLSGAVHHTTTSTTVQSNLVPAALSSSITKHSSSRDQQPTVLPISPASSLNRSVQPTKPSASQQISSMSSNITTVEHDAKAWKNPTFIQTSGKGKAKAPSRIVSSRIEDAPMALSDTSKTQLGQKLSRLPADKIADSSRRRDVPVVVVLPNPKENRKDTEVDVTASAQTQIPVSVSAYGGTPSTRKRTRTTPSESADEQNASKKRRLVDSSEDISNSSVRPEDHSSPQKHDTLPVVVVKPEPADDAVHLLAKRKLAGFTVNFNNIPSADETKPMVNWRGLKGILWRIGRSRKKEGVFKEPPTSS